MPGEVQVIGFDDIAAGRSGAPRPSTVDPGNDTMADATCHLLLERMAGDVGRPARVVMPPVRLVHRESTRLS